MLQPKDAGGEENPDFKWGVKKAVGRTDKNVSFYESFTCQGIEYRLFDCAYFQIHAQCETSIGKLIRMYETSAGEKKVKVLWFFRPIDIRSYLREYEPRWNELFLARGDEPGVYNINDVDTIMGKCKVVCLSDDRRNTPPARSELRNADYVFFRTFDTGLKIISKYFADAIAGIGVEKFFNKTKVKHPPKLLNSRAPPVKSFRSESRLEKKDNRDGKLTSRTSPVKKELFLKDLADNVHVKNPPVNTDITSRGPKTKTRAVGNPLDSGSSVDPKLSKRRKLVLDTPDSDDLGQSREKTFINNPSLVDKAPSQKIGSNSWYKKLLLAFITRNQAKEILKFMTFEEELKEAIGKDRLVLIENLEPSYTSLEVEDLCRQAFHERVDAKMIPASLVSNPNIGRALVIFETKEVADRAISRLTRGCLMINDERPLVGSRDVPKAVGECRGFTGHRRLVDRALMSIEKRKAVSTAHCTQPNHIVHEMAEEWKALQTKSELKWKRLLEQQAKEMNIIFRSKNQEENQRIEKDARPLSQQQNRSHVRILV